MALFTLSASQIYKKSIPVPAKSRPTGTGYLFLLNMQICTLYRGMFRAPGSFCFRARGFVPLQRPRGYRPLSRTSSQSASSKQNTSPDTPQSHEPRSRATGATSEKSSVLSSSFWSCRSTWRRAGINTLRCLIGCTVGDFSALWTLQSYYPELGMNSIMLASSMYQRNDSPTPKRRSSM